MSKGDMTMFVFMLLLGVAGGLIGYGVGGDARHVCAGAGIGVFIMPALLLIGGIFKDDDDG